LLAVSAAVVGAVIIWAVTDVATPLKPTWQWGIMISVGLIFFIATLAIARKIHPDRQQGIAIGRGIRSGGDAEVTDVSVDGAAPKNVEIGTDVKSKGTTRISRIRLGKGREQE
jgi:hypothetical protein